MNNNIGSLIKNIAELKSGILFSSWLDQIGMFQETHGRETSYDLLMCVCLAACDQQDEAEILCDKLPKEARTILVNILPSIHKNQQNRKHGKNGGRPVNYAKNIDICVRKLQKEFHDKTFKGLLDAWFEHLNKHSVSTKKDVLQHTISEFGRLASGVDHAIRLLKKNIAEENLEFDYEAAAVSGLDDEESEEIKLELDDELEELELGDGK